MFRLIKLRSKRLGSLQVLFFLLPSLLDLSFNLLLLSDLIIARDKRIRPIIFDQIGIPWSLCPRIIAPWHRRISRPRSFVLLRCRFEFKIDMRVMLHVVHDVVTEILIKAS